MHTFLIVLLIIDCIALITVVLLQEGKSSGLSGAISGGAEQLFGKQKQRGVDLFLNRLTIIFINIIFCTYDLHKLSWYVRSGDVNVGLFYL